MIDSPGRYGSSLSPDTLNELEERINEYGLSNSEIWFIYLRGSHKFDNSRYYAEVYLHPQNDRGRLLHGDFIVFRTQANEKESERISRVFEVAYSPQEAQPYLWVRPKSVPSGNLPYPVSLATLPIEPPTGLTNTQVVRLIDFIRSGPRLPDRLHKQRFDEEVINYIDRGRQIDTDQTIWQIEAKANEFEVRMLKSDRRRKRGQLLYIGQKNDEYVLEAIGEYGASTNFAMRF